mgnify:CR=1 FL=1
MRSLVAFIKYILPHLLLCMALGLVLIVVLDGYNPMMGFLTSDVSKAYIYILCALAVLTALLYIGETQIRSKNKGKH